MAQDRKLVKQFDKDGDNRLNLEERQAAREFLKKERESGSGGRGFGGPRGFGPFGRQNQEPAKPGPRVNPGDVASYPDKDLYEPTILRTLFFEFESPEWEAELQDFHGTDVEVPATLIVDGMKYPNVGVHFRGMSSYMGVPAGYKRSLDVALDFVDGKQRLHGYKTLNLLNAHDDPTYLDPVLYSRIARQFIPAPRVNLVKVVINGESWGIYANAQQFDKIFLSEHYKSTKGARWKVRGSPGAASGLEYTGDNVEDYKRRFQIKSEDDPKAWQALINLCKVLNQTPPEKLEAALAPILDVDGVLKYLALDITLINCDGYWTRASDYSLYLDGKGKFHVIPHDMNEAFRPPMGPGFGGNMAFRMGTPGEIMPAFVQDTLKLSDDQKKQVAELQKGIDGKLAQILNDEQKKQLKEMRERGPGDVVRFGGPGGPGGPGGAPGGPGGPGGFGPGRGPGGPGFGGGGVDLDPLMGLNDTRKPLRSKLLAVPALKTRYLQYVKAIAEESLDWSTLGPIVASYRALIDQEVKADTRKLDSYEEFLHLTADVAGPDGPRTGRGPAKMSLRAFADQRRKYLLEHSEIKKLPARGDAEARKGGGS
jgi:spore coat protein CotH